MRQINKLFDLTNISFIKQINSLSKQTCVCSLIQLDQTNIHLIVFLDIIICLSETRAAFVHRDQWFPRAVLSTPYYHAK